NNPLQKNPIPQLSQQKNKKFFFFFFPPPPPPSIIIKKLNSAFSRLVFSLITIKSVPRDSFRRMLLVLLLPLLFIVLTLKAMAQTAKVIINPTSFAVIEGGAIQSFTVVLNTNPGFGVVTITFNGNDTDAIKFKNINVDST
ncbi:MAG: hypothetical protein OXH57_00175, partial [Ekhidna sp.]|nr:hypothetical protein [Ekhidna sp.]